MPQVVIRIEVPDGCTVTTELVDAAVVATPVLPVAVSPSVVAISLQDLKAAFLKAATNDEAEAFKVLGYAKCDEVPKDQFAKVHASLLQIPKKG